MKRSIIPVAALFAASALICGGASAFTLSKFKAAPVANLNIPAKPDSTQKENAFDNSKLLKSRLPLGLREQTQDWTTMLADSTGKLNLVRPGDFPQAHTFTTRIRAERFSKGQLKITSNRMAEVLVNGRSVAKKSSSDSVATPTSGSITLNPEADYTVQVNIITLPTDKGEPNFKVEYIPMKTFEDVAVAEGPDLSRRFSTRATMTGERVYSTLLSPDGKYLITKYSERFSANETAYRATLQETATGKILDSDFNVYATWMPKGSAVCFTRKVSGTFDLYTTEIPSMKTQKVASGLPTSSFTITPDGKSLIYSQNMPGQQDKGTMRRIKHPDDRIPGDRDRSYLMRYDIASRTITPLTYGGATSSLCDISNDGSKLLYISQVFRAEEFPFYFKTMVQMDLNTLKSDTIFRNDPYINSAIYSPDAKQLFVTGSPSAFKGVGLNIGKEEIANDFDEQGFIYTLADGSVKPVTKDFDPALQGTPVWNRVDGKIYFRGESGFNINLYSLDPKTGKIFTLNTETSSVNGFSMGDSEANWISYYGGGFTDTGVAYVLNLKNRKNRLVDDPMKAELEGIKFGEMTQWQFTSKDGSLIDGYRCLPPDFDPNKKYPLIVYYYGGTSPSAAAMTSPYAPQVFASRGYVVYVLNPSGTTGYGQEFSARHVNAWGKRTADEIIEGVKKFCDANPFVDRKKIGCLGASYGGFMTEYLQTKTDIFAAAVSHAGISNVTSYWGEGYWGYSYDAVAAAKSYPWNNPDLFTKQGALFNADKIKTPLLLLHGNQDTNVPMGESIQLFNALRILGRTVEFIQVDGENHVITNFDKKLIWQDTIMAWFAKYLQNDSRWWDELYGK